METKVITMASHEFGTVRKIKENGKMLYCGIDVAKALGYAVPRKAILDHCKGVLKRNTLTNGGKQTLNFIPEGDVWRLICHSKLPNAEQFEKWIFDDVVPTVAKTGKYEIPTKGEQLTLETAEYHYFDKTFNGQPIITGADFEHFTGIRYSTAEWYLRRNAQKHIDYILLEGPWLMQYKAQNPNVSRLASAVFAVTKSGFVKLMKYYGCKADVPKCFVEEKKPSTAVMDAPAPAPRKVNSDESIVALNVLRYIKACNLEFMENDKKKGIDTMTEYYKEKISVIDGAIKAVGMLVGAGY